MSRSIALPRQQDITIRSIFSIASFFLLILAVVVPNSIKIITAITMSSCFVLALLIIKLNSRLLFLVFFYLASVCVTLFYILIGTHNGAPSVAVEQVIVIYIISPLLWIYISASLIQAIGIDNLVRWFVVLAYLCCASVALYFFLYTYFGQDAVSFFRESGNLHIKEGYAGATMHVYGSLIFLCGGFFSSPEIIRTKSLRLLLLAALLTCAITSGRSALILSVFIGILLGFFLTSRTIIATKRKLKHTVTLTITVIFSIMIFVFSINYLTEIDIWLILNIFYEKLLSGGGLERVEQASALAIGIIDSFGLGSGHGIGVDYLRSVEYPWRYELIWMATIFRVGLIGAMVYVAPFLFYFQQMLKLIKKRKISTSEKFLFSGFVCAFIASSTNPYIEGIVFQWMFIIPMVALFMRPVDKK